MAVKQSKQVAANHPVATPRDAAGLVAVVAEYVVPAGGVPIGDVVEMSGLPAYAVPVDLVVHNGAGAAASTLAFGLLTGNYGSLDAGRACGAEFIAAFAVQNANITRMGKGYVANVGSDDSKGWGFVVAGAALQAGQVIRAILQVAPANTGISAT